MNPQSAGAGSLLSGEPGFIWPSPHSPVSSTGCAVPTLQVPAHTATRDPLALSSSSRAAVKRGFVAFASPAGLCAGLAWSSAAVFALPLRKGMPFRR